MWTRKLFRNSCAKRTSRPLQLYAQSDMEAKHDAQGKFLEQLLGEQDSSAGRSEFSDYLGWNLGWKKIGEIV